MENTDKIVVYVSPGLRELVARDALRERKSVSELVRVMLEEAYAEEDEASGDV